MASEACARRGVRKLGVGQANHQQVNRGTHPRRATPMIFTQYAAYVARTFMAVELAMARRRQ
jgi:hypothetical protein